MAVQEKVTKEIKWTNWGDDIILANASNILIQVSIPLSTQLTLC